MITSYLEEMKKKVVKKAEFEISGAGCVTCMLVKSCKSFIKYYSEQMETDISHKFTDLEGSNHIVLFAKMKSLPSLNRPLSSFHPKIKEMVHLFWEKHSTYWSNTKVSLLKQL